MPPSLHHASRKLTSVDKKPLELAVPRLEGAVAQAATTVPILAAPDLSMEEVYVLPTTAAVPAMAVSRQVTTAAAIRETLCRSMDRTAVAMADIARLDPHVCAATMMRP